MLIFFLICMMKNQVFEKGLGNFPYGNLLKWLVDHWNKFQICPDTGNACYNSSEFGTRIVIQNSSSYHG